MPTAFGERMTTSARGNVTKVRRRFERFATKVRMLENQPLLHHWLSCT